MFRSNWLPLLCTIILFSLFFIDNIGVKDDTTISFDQSGNICEEITPDEADEGSFITEDELNKFLVEYKGDFGHFTKEQLLDTTGDGEKEVVRSSVDLKSGVCSIDLEILKDGQKIWHEDFEFRKEDLSWYYSGDGDETGTNQALFYLGMKFSEFTGRLEKDQAYFAQRDRIIENCRRHGKAESDLHSWLNMRKKLDSYTGEFVFKRTPGNQGIFMWDELSKSFVQICYPANLSV